MYERVIYKFIVGTYINTRYKHRVKVYEPLTSYN